MKLHIANKALLIVLGIFWILFIFLCTKPIPSITKERNLSHTEAEQFALLWVGRMRIENPRIICELTSIGPTKICSIFGDNMKAPISIICNNNAFCYVK